MNCRQCKTVERDYECIVVALRDPECPNARDKALEAGRKAMDKIEKEMNSAS